MYPQHSIWYHVNNTLDVNDQSKSTSRNSHMQKKQNILLRNQIYVAFAQDIKISYLEFERITICKGKGFRCKSDD